ncbi:MAG TPA: DNA-binding domain-containing protein [Steroidobacteraceae bacterium]|nr:DNA-binding domain-containing protein [Steroidobacteraceae bacterium]
MSALARLQEEFQDYLLRGARAIEARVAGTARVPLAVRLGIYAGAYGSRLAEALAGNYPALARLLGEDDFRALAAAYVRTHDSPYFSIRCYGEGLADFLAGRAEYAQAPLLAELARWEWALAGVFDAADAGPIGPEALASIAPSEWAGLRFAWHPSLRRLALAWNAPQLWKALTEDAERPALEVLATPVEWLAWRRGLDTFFRPLAPAEAAALDAARAGASFGALCEQLAAAHGPERAAGEAAALLRGWLESGLVVAAAPG